ncbi:protein XRI1-like [Silene latifolia]|uniref:protein XRI1-like n=1 Tax=Silene latifolia TaxID=37657 RepID=UPI003D78993E
MDYQINEINDNQLWAWEGDDIYLQADVNIEDISCMFEETTPIKACGDFADHFNDHEIMTKTPQEGKEYSSQIKRRRILDFDSASEGISPSTLKSKERIDADSAILPEADESLQDDFSPPNIEDFGESEAWLAECLNDTYLNISSDDGNASVSSDLQIGSKEVCHDTPNSGSHIAQRPVRSSRNVIFKGRKSYMRTPSKVPSSVAYPFDFIKPCGDSGGMTLKDINQRIHTPPPKPKEAEDEIIYPTSAFSGKPVVGKTKIPTQGGKGSITIMRTKG